MHLFRPGTSMPAQGSSLCYVCSAHDCVFLGLFQLLVLFAQTLQNISSEVQNQRNKSIVGWCTCV